MTAPWRKAWRDLWRERSRAVLVVLAVAVGLTGLLTVFSSYAVLVRELNLGYLATNPASIVIRADDLDATILAEVIARPDVVDADARRMVNGRLFIAPTSSRRLVLFVIRDFTALRINRVTPDLGAWPPALGELLIERDAFPVAHARVGDTVTIELTKAHPQTLRVAGGVHDAGQAQARMENTVYAYITPETLAALGEAAALDRLHIIAAGDRNDVAHLQRVGDDVKRFLENRGHAVRRVEVPPPGQHPHAGIMDLLLTTIGLFGLFVLFLSGVIVTNLLLSMMARERRQIGVMKAMGGSRAQIARVYLAEAGLLGLAAVAVATPLGIVGGRMVSQRLAVLLNFDLTSLANPAWFYLVVLGLGLLVPLAAAASPVATATAVTVRAALTPNDVGSAFVPGRADRALARFGGGWSPLLLGVRNSLRRKLRTALTVATLTIAGAFFMSALNVRLSMMATLDARFGPMSAGSEARYAYEQHFLMIYVFLFIVSGLLAGIGGLGAITTAGLNVLDRRRELGVLRAIGASPAAIRGIVMLESTFIALVSAVLALLVAIPVSVVAGRLLTALVVREGVRSAVDWRAMFLWLAFSLMLGVVSSLVPAVIASRRSIREAINHE